MTRPLALDTNIILLDANNVITLGQNREIILSEVVLEEIDNKKTVMGDIGYSAREFGRMLGRARLVYMENTDMFHMTEMLLDGVTIKILANVKYYGDSVSNDQKIIMGAQAYEEFIGEPIEFMSNDMMCKHRAMVIGLDVSEFKVIDDDGFEFVKSIEIDDPEVFRVLHYKSIYDIDTEHSPENFSYKFQCATTGQVKLGIVLNGVINIIGKDTEKDLRRQNANPCNAEQLLMSKAIQEPIIDIVMVEAQAGSGKTLLAFSNAMRLLDLNRDRYDSIVYMRNTVDDYGNDDEQVGFLSGNEEKFAVYLGPVRDTLDFMVRDKIKANKLKGEELELKVDAEIDSMKAKYHIQEVLALGTRGRTFSNCVIIIDEAQNIGAATMQKLLSRIGKNCKVIVIGSNRQIDSKYLTKWNNGLSILLGHCKSPKFQSDVGLFAINLEKTVRSKLAEFTEKLFS